jgi:hypothetical protein
MKAPSNDDRYVNVTAYLTDETFGYDHWRAAQFCSPPGRPAILIICSGEEDREQMLQRLRATGPLTGGG